MKVVINADYGGFYLSRAACQRMAELGNAEAAAEIQWRGKHFSGLSRFNDRADPTLVQVVEELGPAAGSDALKVVEVPDNVDWYIEEFDGKEHVAEVHRTWR